MKWVVSFGILFLKATQISWQLLHLSWKFLNWAYIEISPGPKFILTVTQVDNSVIQKDIKNYVKKKCMYTHYPAWEILLLEDNIHWTLNILWTLWNLLSGWLNRVILALRPLWQFLEVHHSFRLMLQLVINWTVIRSLHQLLITYKCYNEKENGR